MSDFNIYDFQSLAAERGINISFDKTGMSATRDDEDICKEYHYIEYELLINLDMTLLDLIDVWFPQKTEEQEEKKDE